MPERHALELPRYAPLPAARCSNGLRFLRRQGAKKQLRRLRDRFAPERARGVNAVIEFRVEMREAEVESFQLVISDGRCGFAERPRTPTATIELELEDLEALVEGRASTAPLFMSQRLRVLGDALLAVRLPDFFPIDR